MLLINYQKINIAELGNEIEKIENEYEKYKKDGITELNFYKWLNGRIKFKLNGLKSCLNEKSKLINQVNSLFY